MALKPEALQLTQKCERDMAVDVLKSQIKDFLTQHLLHDWQTGSKMQQLQKYKQEQKQALVI